MIFELDNIELELDGRQILNGIYLKAETGRITGVLGANGTGKSSLLKIFFGSLKPLHKLVRIDSQAFLKPLYTSGMVKYLPQHFVIPSSFRISRAFDFYRVNWDQFLIAFPSFNIHRRSRMGELSGGEVRIIEIYLSLKSDSRLVLLDEPFTHLAPNQVEIMKSIMREETENKGIVVTDHMYRHIIEVADELYLLKNGCSKRIKEVSELVDYRFLNPESSGA